MQHKMGKFYRAPIIKVNKNEYTIPGRTVGDTSFSSLDGAMPSPVTWCSIKTLKNVLLPHLRHLWS